MRVAWHGFTSVSSRSQFTVLPGRLLPDTPRSAVPLPGCAERPRSLPRTQPPAADPYRCPGGGWPQGPRSRRTKAGEWRGSEAPAPALTLPHELGRRNGSSSAPRHGSSGRTVRSTHPESLPPKPSSKQANIPGNTSSCPSTNPPPRRTNPMSNTAPPTAPQTRALASRAVHGEPGTCGRTRTRSRLCRSTAGEWWSPALHEFAFLDRHQRTVPVTLSSLSTAEPSGPCADAEQRAPKWIIRRVSCTGLRARRRGARRTCPAGESSYSPRRPVRMNRPRHVRDQRLPLRRDRQFSARGKQVGSSPPLHIDASGTSESSRPPVRRRDAAFHHGDCKRPGRTGLRHGGKNCG